MQCERQVESAARRGMESLVRVFREAVAVARRPSILRVVSLFTFGVGCVAPSAMQAQGEPGGPIAPLTATLIDSGNVGTLHVEHFGRPGGQALIFIPALFCGPWQWYREIDALAPSYDIYALTLPGFDGRPFTSSHDLMRRAVQNISNLIAEKRLVHPILVGHSLGGTLAVLFAERHPRTARAVIAVEGGRPIAPTADERARQADAFALAFRKATPASLDSVLRADQLRYTITDSGDVAVVARYAARSSPAAIADWLVAALSLDLTPRLDAVSGPVVEIVPFDSTIDSYQGFATLNAKRDAYTRWLAHARHGSLEMIDHSRHFVMFDRPAVFDSVLFSTIRRDSPAP